MLFSWVWRNSFIPPTYHHPRRSRAWLRPKAALGQIRWAFGQCAGQAAEQLEWKRFIEVAHCRRRPSKNLGEAHTSPGPSSGGRQPSRRSRVGTALSSAEPAPELTHRGVQGFPQPGRDRSPRRRAPSARRTTRWRCGCNDRFDANLWANEIAPTRGSAIPCLRAARRCQVRIAASTSRRTATKNAFS